MSERLTDHEVAAVTEMVGGGLEFWAEEGVWDLNPEVFALWTNLDGDLGVARYPIPDLVWARGAQLDDALRVLAEVMPRAARTVGVPEYLHPPNRVLAVLVIAEAWERWLDPDRPEPDVTPEHDPLSRDVRVAIAVASDTTTWTCRHVKGQDEPEAVEVRRDQDSDALSGNLLPGLFGVLRALETIAEGVAP